MLLTSLIAALSASAQGEVVSFFDAAQTVVPWSSGVTSETIRCEGYQFTYTRDKLFTGGTGQIIGRYERVPLPDGLEAQSVTTPPAGQSPAKAQITITRVDGTVFALPSLSFMLLANTAGAGRTLEITPQLQGEDGFNDPIYFDATGYYGQTFSYDSSANYWGSTEKLHDFDTYKIGLSVDFALTSLALDGAPVPEPGMGMVLWTACALGLMRRSR